MAEAAAAAAAASAAAEAQQRTAARMTAKKQAAFRKQSQLMTSSSMNQAAGAGEDARRAELEAKLRRRAEERKNRHQAKQAVQALPEGGEGEEDEDGEDGGGGGAMAELSSRAVSPARAAQLLRKQSALIASKTLKDAASAGEDRRRAELEARLRQRAEERKNRRMAANAASLPELSEATEEEEEDEDEDEGEEDQQQLQQRQQQDSGDAEEESEEEDGEGLASLPREDSPTRGAGSPGTSALLRNMPPLQMRRAGNPMPNLLARRRTGAAGPPALGLPSMNEEQEYNDEESDSISDLDSQGSPSSRDVSPTRSAMGALGLPTARRASRAPSFMTPPPAGEGGDGSPVTPGMPEGYLAHAMRRRSAQPVDPSLGSPSPPGLPAGGRGNAVSEMVAANARRRSGMVGVNRRTSGLVAGGDQHGVMLSRRTTAMVNEDGSLAMAATRNRRTTAMVSEDGSLAIPSRRMSTNVRKASHAISPSGEGGDHRRQSTAMNNGSPGSHRTDSVSSFNNKVLQPVSAASEKFMKKINKGNREELLNEEQVQALRKLSAAGGLVEDAEDASASHDRALDQETFDEELRQEQRKGVQKVAQAKTQESEEARRRDKARRAKLLYEHENLTHQQRIARMMARWKSYGFQEYFLAWKNYTIRQKRVKEAQARVTQYLEVLTKEPWDRDDTDIELLYKFVQEVKFFTGLERDVALDLCRAFRLEEFEDDEVVFMQGDEGITFYIILYGQVSIWSEAPPKPEESEKEEGVRSGSEDDTSEEEDENAGRKLLATLGQGDAFGELALLKNQPRAATVQTDEPTWFVVIDKEDYDETIKSTHQKNIQTKVDFLCRMPLFKECSVSELNELVGFFAVAEYAPGTSILTQGQEASAVHFVVSGDVDIVKNVQIEAPPPASEKSCSEKSSKSTKTREAQALMSVCKRWGIFGEYAIMTRRQQPYSAITRSGCTTYTLSLHDFFMRLNPRTLQLFRQYIKMTMEDTEAERCLVEKGQQDICTRDMLRSARREFVPVESRAFKRGGSMLSRSSGTVEKGTLRSFYATRGLARGSRHRERGRATEGASNKEGAGEEERLMNKFGLSAAMDALGDRENALAKFIEEKASKSLGPSGGAKAAPGPKDEKGRKKPEALKKAGGGGVGNGDTAPAKKGKRPQIIDLRMADQIGLTNNSTDFVEEVAVVYGTVAMDDPNKIIPGHVMDAVFSECDSAALLHKIEAVRWDSVTLMLLCFEGQSLKEKLERVADAVLMLKDRLAEVERLDNMTIDDPEEKNHYDLCAGLEWGAMFVSKQVTFITDVFGPGLTAVEELCEESKIFGGIRCKKRVCDLLNTSHFLAISGSDFLLEKRHDYKHLGGQVSEVLRVTPANQASNPAESQSASSDVGGSAVTVHTRALVEKMGRLGLKPAKPSGGLRGGPSQGLSSRGGQARFTKTRRGNKIPTFCSKRYQYRKNLEQGTGRDDASVVSEDDASDCSSVQNFRQNLRLI